MKKILSFMFVLILFLSLASAINVNVEKLSSDEVLVIGTGMPVEFNLKLINQGPADNFEFYNLLGFTQYPIGTTYIGQEQSKQIKMALLPIGDLNVRGPYTFSYYISGQDGTQQKKDLTFKIIDLKDAFEVGASEINPNTNSLEVYIRNLVNFDFGEVSASFSSAFFDLDETFNIGPNEKIVFPVQLNQKDFNKLMAGFYTLSTNIDVGDQSAKVEGIIKFVEKDILTSTKKDYGFIINTQIINKVNEGNVVAESETVIKKNIFSRLFTSFSPEPDSVDRDGTVVYYTWIREINPGEALEIKIKTNWLFPLLLILFIIVIVILSKQYTKTNLVLRKRVHFVKAKGGEFALKVSIFVQAKHYVERVNIIDRLPPLVKLFDRFSGDTPTRVSEKARRIEWDFEKLEGGESRTLSYIIYSKIGVLGRFALPSTTAIYQRDGKFHESISNKAFFVAEQSKIEKN